MDVVEMRSCAMPTSNPAYSGASSSSLAVHEKKDLFQPSVDSIRKKICHIYNLLPYISGKHILVQGR